MTELEAIESAQDAIAQLKAALRTIQIVNSENGRPQASNAAMGLRGEVIAFHARSTELLYVFYPEHGDEITTRGGGSR